MIIAIDGPAGSGKSTIARSVAERLGLHYLDTGAMYRAVTYAALARGLDLEDEPAVSEIARTIDITFDHEAAAPIPSRVLSDGNDVTVAIRTPRVDSGVSIVARMPAVRAAMVPLQRAAAASGDLVAEGRDIGTVVFPDAGLKVFLTASAEERARRRHAELLDRGESLDETAVRTTMAERDHADSSRAAAPLTPAADAVLLDTTGLTVDEVVDEVVRLADAGMQ